MRSVDLQKLVEEGAVLEHGGAEIFGGGFVACEALSDGVGGAVVFDDARVVDGNVGGALLKVGDWIAACVHERGDEFVGFDDGTAGVVDEAGLDDLPIGEEAFALGGCEVADVEGVDALFACGEGGLGTALGAAFKDGAIVFGAEAIAQALGILLALSDDHGNDDGKDDDKDYKADDEAWIRWIHLHGFSLLRGIDAISCCT